MNYQFCQICNRRIDSRWPNCRQCQMALCQPPYTLLYDGPHPVNKEQFIENAFPPYEEAANTFQPLPDRTFEKLRLEKLGAKVPFEPGQMMDAPFRNEPPPEYINLYEGLYDGPSTKTVAAPPIRQPKPRFRLRHLAGILLMHLLIVCILEAWGVHPVERIRQAIVQFIHLEKP